MHWILWTLLFFQGHPGDSNARSLESVQGDEFSRESSISDARSKRSKTSNESARRMLAAAQEKQFLDRYNRLMKAMVDFAESYNQGHAINSKLLQAVKHAWQDLQKHDALFREGAKE